MHFVVLDRQDQIATILLNRPDKLNAMNDAMLEELDAALDRVEKDDNIKVVIFQGAGRAFSVGRDASGVGTSDIEPPRGASATRQAIWQKRYQARWQRIASLPKNTIARIHGYCLDAGCWIALSCQVAIATEDAMFGEPAVRLGQVTPMPLWSHLLGLKRATEMLFTGELITGKEAESMGLIMRAVPVERLDDEVNAVAREMVAISLDGQVARLEGNQVASDIMGLGAAWRHWGRLHLESLLRKPARGDFDFVQVRNRRGMKAAIDEANAPFVGIS
ncbi:MAG: enoyl-CoA hydratase/isomerase family protein [Chloroflexi bacterium]|nr:enoyl-CoA hydratase/isomerase family protein [Chloroflexota bacterium]